MATTNSHSFVPSCKFGKNAKHEFVCFLLKIVKVSKKKVILPLCLK